MESTQQGTSRITIRENWDIGVLEIHIHDYLSNCEIWGDLNISPAEYDLIKKRISAALGSNPTSKQVKALFNRYPLLMVTDMINFVLYEFDNNEFWSGWASRYNIEININNRAEIGKNVRDIFKKYNFEVIEDGGYTYVTPILCQAGIPSACFDKLFDIIDSTLNSSYFLPEEIVSELMGFHSYLIDVPVLRYIRTHTDRAIELIAQLREMIQVVGDIRHEDQDIPEVPGVQQRIVQRYAQWRAEIKKLGRKNSENTQYFFSPKLVYDEVRGICLFIPEQTLRQDSIYKLKWTIIRDDDVNNAKIYYSQVYNSNSKNYTLEAKIPVEHANSYTIELRDDDRDSVLLTKSWTIVGLGAENNVMVFNEHGSAVTRNQRYLSRKGTVIVLDSKRTKITEFHNVYKKDLDLPKSWAGFQAFYAYPTEGDALLTIQALGEVIYLESSHTFDMELVQNDTLFHEKYNSKEIPVYTRFPTIEVSGYGENIERKVFLNWQVVIIHRLSNTRRIVTLSELNFQVYGETMRFSINDCAQEYFAGMYGAYDLKVYDGKNRRFFTFYFSPALQSVSQVEDVHSSSISFRNSRVLFHVRKSDSATLEFENDSGINVLPSVKGAEWMEISTNNKPAYIKGYVVFNYNDSARKLPFKKTIRELEWSFWDEQENELTEIGVVKQFYREDFENTIWRLALHFTDRVDKYKSVKLALEGANSEELQSKEIKLDGFGNGAATLNLFQDTMGAHSLPQRLMLYIFKEYDREWSICLAIVRSFVQLRNPRYSLIKDKPIIYWDPSTKNELLNKQLELISLNDHNLEPLKYSLTDTVRGFKGKEGKRFEGIELEKPLVDGAYYIDAREEMEFSFFEDEEQALPVYDKDHVVCVNGKQVLENLYASNSNSIVDWLSTALVAMKKQEWIESLSARLKIRIEEGTLLLFDARECSPLLFSLIINSGKKSNLAPEIKLETSRICNLINDFIITNNNRIEILEVLLRSNASDLDCKTIVEELQLYLFCPNGTVVFDKSSVQRMWDINEKMAILMNIRGCVSNISIDIDRILNRIGWESIEEMLRFLPKPNCDSHNWTECIELSLGTRCKCENVHFECSKRVWGDGNEYSKLWVADKRGNWNRQIPDRSHTDGYEIFGKSYLTLIYELTPENQDLATKQYVESANQEIYKAENLTLKYLPYFHDLHSVLRNRLADNTGNQKLFYQIGCSSALIALATRHVINSADLQELLPFYKNAMGAYPELVYRDLILAELTIFFGSGRRN